jgi:hypothetical protein
MIALKKTCFDFFFQKQQQQQHQLLLICIIECIYIRLTFFQIVF